MSEHPADVRRMFTERTASYARFIRAVLYPQGLRGYFLRAPFLRPGLRVLDAGCGTGAVTLGLRDALARRGMEPAAMHAFDLTPAMLDRFRRELTRRRLAGIDLAEADVLQPETLPAGWGGYDLVVSASMLEYVPRDRFVDAVAGIRGHLRDGGLFVLFITRRSWLMRPLIGRWWASQLYTARELLEAFPAAGFATPAFDRFPWPFRHLDGWGHIVVARR